MSQTTRPAPEPVQPPRMIDYASMALIAQAVAWIIAALAFRVEKSAYTTYVYDHATKKNGQHYEHSGQDAVDIAKLVSNQQKSILLEAIILAIALVLLAFFVRKVRGASPARWAVVIIAILTQTPLAVLAITSGIPPFIKVTQFLVGLLSIASIVLLFLAPSRQYFRAARSSVAESLPPRPARPARGGRSGGLFGPRPAAGRGATAAPSTTPDAPRVDLTKGGGPSDKRRADATAASVAKGAALARSRAKAAAKSRRTED